MDYYDHPMLDIDDDDMGGGSSGSASPELLISRHNPSEKAMIKAYAAESIQDAYRRYSECKPYVKQLKAAKYDKFVMNIAADTIKDNVKKFVKSKSKESVLSRSSSGSSLNKKALKIQVEDSMYEEDVDVYSSAQPKSPTSKPLSPVPPLDLSPMGGKKSSNGWTHDEKLGSNADEKLTGSKASASSSSSFKDEPLQEKAGGASQRAEAKGADKVNRRTRNSEHKSPRPQTAPAPSAASSSNAKPGKSVSSSGVDKDTKRAAIKAAVDADKKPHTSIRRSVPNLLAAKAWLVVDEAMSLAMRRECSFIKLQPHEAVKVLDALGYPLDVHIVQGVINRSKERHSRADERIEIPLTGPGPLAATLTAFGKSSEVISDYKYFSVGEEAAGVALKHINALVQGPWRKNRTFLLRTMCDSDTNPRPSMWNGATVREFIAALQLPTENFGIISDKSIYNHFLYIEKDTLKESFRIAPSVLQARFSVYQHVLRLLDQWWDRGIRPDDEYLKYENKINIAKSAEFKSMKDVNGVDEWGVFKGANALELEGEAANSEVDVQVAYSHLLLQSWVPLNRAYDWGVSIESLNSLATAVGGMRGWISRRSGQAVGGGGGALDDLAFREDVKGCRWVRLGDARQPRSDETPWPSLFQRSPALHNIAKLSGDDVGGVLVPISAMRPTAIKARVGIAEGELQIGDIVTVITEELLRRALERLDWWDRPSSDVVKRMAGRKAEVVSTAALYTSKMVGIRIDEIGVTDALPLEALFSIDAVEEEPEEGTEDEPTKSKKPKAKKRKVRAAPRPVVTLVSQGAPEAKPAKAPGKAVVGKAGAAQAKLMDADMVDLDSCTTDPTAAMGAPRAAKEEKVSFSATVQRGGGTPRKGRALSDFAPRGEAKASAAALPSPDEKPMPSHAPAEASPPKRPLYRPSSTASSPVAEPKVDKSADDPLLRRDPSDFTLILDEAPPTGPSSRPREELPSPARRASESQFINIKLPLPSLEAVDYSWLKLPARLSPQVLSPSTRLSVDIAAQTEEDNDSNLMIHIPYGDYRYDEHQPMLNIITPIFDVKNAEYGDGINNGRFALQDERVFDKDSLQHKKLSGKQKSPPYVRRIKQIASNKRPVFDDSFDLLPNVVTDDFGVLGKAFAGKKPPAGARAVLSLDEEEPQEAPQIAVVIPAPPAAPVFNTRQRGDKQDPIIEKIDYEMGMFGVEGRGVGKPFVEPPNMKPESIPKTSRPKTATARVGSRLASNLAMTDNLPDDVMGEGLHLGAATVTGLKPKAKARPQSASYQARARLLDNYKTRAEIADDIESSIDRKEEDYKRLEELRSSREIEKLEKLHEKEIKEISKM